LVCPKTNSAYDLHLSGCIYVGWPTPTRGATAPLFFWTGHPAAFQNLAWLPGLVPGSGANTWKRKANAKDRKRIERTRSQKAAEKK